MDSWIYGGPSRIRSSTNHRCVSADTVAYVHVESFREKKKTKKTRKKRRNGVNISSQNAGIARFSFSEVRRLILYVRRVTPSCVMLNCAEFDNELVTMANDQQSNKLLPHAGVYNTREICILFIFYSLFFPLSFVFVSCLKHRHAKKPSAEYAS